MNKDIITQEDLDADQAFYCSQVVWPEYLQIEESTYPLESHKFIILDFSKDEE